MGLDCPTVTHKSGCDVSRSVGATHSWSSLIHLLDVAGVREDMKKIEE